ncbi:MULTISPECIES: hypothetical protein [unclassified Granulicatella]|uniref:hypothetical protein n=1 Tax=unclassified Granulicatella TaxID=2630493 RepID=UPI001073F6F6|nr:MULTISPECIES: hypothetical protein [unclassified Granulicatella]MBF0780598.1 hypothetical protein [Granulicatella sp. 19428wC4_WM01]TFU94626.1 hypothetical protein E4T68_05745 [Granulicatella sp. WM01]
MQKLGSEFLDDFDLPKEEGTHMRLVCLYAGMVLGVLVTIGVILLELPDVLYLVCDVLFVFPLVFYGVSADRHFELQEKCYFFTLETTRVYQTELD